MDDRKIILLGIIVAIVLAGGMWYFSQDDNPAALVAKEEANLTDITDASVGSSNTEELPSTDPVMENQPPTEKIADIPQAEETKAPDINLISQDPFLGSADAPVTIIEYFSYGCGHCKTFHQQTLPILKEKYIDSGQVNYMAYQLFGIEQLPQAALCAAEQGHYWAYHDYLFNHASQISTPDDLVKLKDFAAALGLDQEKFNTCYDQSRYQEKVTQWVAAGKELSISGVPVFFINGQPLTGNQSLAAFEEIINQQLNN